MTRAELMEKAGLDAEKQATILRESVEQLRRLQNATKTEFFSFRGDIVDTAEVADHATQLAATAQLLDLIGAKAGKSQGSDARPTVVINVDTPDWAQPRVEVVEAERGSDS